MSRVVWPEADDCLRAIILGPEGIGNIRFRVHRGSVHVSVARVGRAFPPLVEREHRRVEARHRIEGGHLGGRSTWSESALATPEGRCRWAKPMVSLCVACKGLVSVNRIVEVQLHWEVHVRAVDRRDRRVCPNGRTCNQECHADANVGQVPAVPGLSHKPSSRPSNFKRGSVDETPYLRRTCSEEP